VMFSEVQPDVTRLPRPVLPPGALVVMFSPLVDKRAFAVVEDLRQRRVRTVVVDVLRTSPPTRFQRRRPDPLAVRVWQLDRAAGSLGRPLAVAAAAAVLVAAAWRPAATAAGCLVVGAVAVGDLTAPGGLDPIGLALAAALLTTYLVLVDAGPSPWLVPAATVA